MEALKPLVVLALFGMILYGAYTVVQKGPTPESVASQPTEPPPVVVPEARSTGSRPDAPSSTPVGTFTPAPQGAVPRPDVTPATPTVPPNATTYLPAESAPPPSADQVVPPAAAETSPADERASRTSPPAPPTIGSTAFAPAEARATSPPLDASAVDASTVAGGPSSAAFASAWSDAHDKLVAERYAEALAALSVWYDDPSLGLEESQRLEDLLGQLAGTVIYSQQDLLLPPHVVVPGETLATVAAPLGVSPQLLAKINGVDDPERLVPGEHLKVVRGPFDAVVSVSRRRISLQLNGSYAGSFPVVIGRRFLDKVGTSLPVIEVQRGTAAAAPIPVGTASLRRSLVLGDGLVIEAVDDPVAVVDAVPQTSLVMSVRDLDELLDILGPASRVLVRQ